MTRAVAFFLTFMTVAPWALAASASPLANCEAPSEPAGEHSVRDPAREATNAGGPVLLPFLAGATEATAFDCDSTATIEDLLASAREMFVAGNHALAEILYTCVLLRNSSHLSAMLELSVVYEATGKLQYALALLERAAILKPYDKEIIDRRGEVAAKLTRVFETEVDSLLERGAFHAALPKLSALLTANPDKADFYFKKARCFLGLGDAKGALVEIDRAVGIRKDARYFALRSEALALDAAKDTDELVREARRLAATGRPEDRERAFAAVSQVLARDPDNRWAKEQFELFTAGGAGSVPDETRKNRRSIAAGQAARWRDAAMSHATAFVSGVVDTLARHLGLLLAALIVLVVFRSPLTDKIARGYETRRALSGRLDQFHIQEILSLIHSQGRSGVLRVYAGPVKGRVYFSGGEIHHSESGASEGRDAIGRLLARATEGHFVLTRLPRSFKRTIDVPFSLVLMDLGEKSFLNAGRSPAEASPPVTRQKSKMKSLLENKLR